MITQTCEICKKEFKSYESWKKLRRTCSRSCMGQLKSLEKSGINHPFFGRHHSKETKLKISKNNRSSRCVGKDNGVYGKSSWNKGIKLSAEQIKKLTDSHKGKAPWNKGKPAYWAKGKLNNNWKGGVTSENEQLRKSIEYKQWRQGIFERDDYTCQSCGKRGGIDLNANHKKPWSLFPELRFDLDNGETLCIPCHKLTFSYLNAYIKKEDFLIG